MSEGFYLSSTNGEMWDKFKRIIKIAQESDPTQDTLDRIKEIAESGIEYLRGEAL